MKERRDSDLKVGGYSLEDVATEVLSNLDKDLKTLKEKASFIFDSDTEISNHTRLSVDFLRSWVVQRNRPSLTAFCIFAMENMKISDDSYVDLVLLSSILGEVPNDLPYHNNAHYAKVLFQLVRMMAVYQDIYEDTSRSLNDKEMALLLSCACIHDLAHDGKGNTIKGHYIQHRLEKNSFDIAINIYELLNMIDDSDKDVIYALLMCTDVTPFKDPGNAVNQAKAAYRFHYLGEQKKLGSLNLDENLSVLEESPLVCAMALILHEADIATSAALSYDVTKYETKLLMAEVSNGEARPSHVMDFLNDICERQMLTDVGQRLYAGNLARIFVLTEEDVLSGNHLYDDIQQSSFLKTPKVKANHQGSTSVN